MPDRKYYRGNLMGDVEHDTAIGGIPMLDKAATINATHADGTKINCPAHGLDVGSTKYQVEITDCQQPTYDGIWEIVTVIDANNFTVKHAYDAGDVGKTMLCSCRSSWVLEDGTDTTHPAAGDTVIFDRHAQEVPDDIDDRVTLATYGKMHEAGMHWNCVVGMDGFATLEIQACHLTSEYLGHVGYYEDRNDNNAEVIDPLQMHIAASGLLTFRLSNSQKAYIECSDGATGTTSIPVVVHDTDSANLYLSSDGIEAEFTEIHCLNAGRLEGLDQSDLDGTDDEDVQEGCIIDTVNVYGTSVIVDLHQECSKTAVDMITGQQIATVAGSIAIDGSGAPNTNFDPELNVGDRITVEYAAGDRDTRYVTARTTDTDADVEFAMRKSETRALANWHFRPAVDVNVYNGYLYSQSPLGQVHVSGEGVVELGQSDGLEILRLDVDNVQTDGGTFTWRQRGILRAAEVDGGTLQASGSGTKTIGLAQGSQTSIIEVYSGICDLSGALDELILNTNCDILYRGGALSLPKDVKAEWVTTL